MAAAHIRAFNALHLLQALAEVKPAASRPGADLALAAAVQEAELLLADVLAVEVAAP